MSKFRDDLRALRSTVWHLINLTEGGQTFKPDLLQGSKRLLNVPHTGSCSHLRIYLNTKESRFSQIHLLDKSATVKCQDNLERTYRL